MAKTICRQHINYDNETVCYHGEMVAREIALSYREKVENQIMRYLNSLTAKELKKLKCIDGNEVRKYDGKCIFR